MNEKEKRRGGIWLCYEVDVEKRQLKLKRRKCPRCGSLMGFYNNEKRRYYCGRCHLTEFI